MATRRSWTEESIRNEIAPIVAELGRMPTRRELSDRGLGGAWSAMQRNGGLDAWRKRLDGRLERPVVPPSRDDIAVHAYYLAQEHGGDPVENWLAAESRLLAT